MFPMSGSVNEMFSLLGVALFLFLCVVDYGQILVDSGDDSEAISWNPCHSVLQGIPRFAVPSRTGRFGAYRTVPVRNRYGSASKNGPGSRIVQKILNRTGTVWYSTVPVSFVRFGLVRVRFGSNNVIRGKIYIFFNLVKPDTVRYGPYRTIPVSDRYRSRYRFFVP